MLMSDRTDGELQSQIQYRLTEEMVAAKARYRDFADRVHDIVIECDAKGTLTYVNRAWEEVLGYSSSESLGRSVTEFLNPSGSPAAFEAYVERHSEVLVNRPDGTQRWLEMSFWPNTPDGFVGFLHHVTERKEAQRLQEAQQRWLQQERENLHAVLDGVPVAMLLVDEHRQVLRHNMAATRLVGKAPEAMGCRLGDFLSCARSFDIPQSERDVACHECVVRDAIEQVLAGDVAVRDVDASMSLLIDGKTRDFYLNVHVSRLDLNGIKQALLCMIDLTERKQAEEALRRSEQQFSNLFNRSPDAIFVEDPNGNVLDANPAACRLHGVDRQTLIGKHVLELVPPDRREEVTRDFSKLVKGELDCADGYSWTNDRRAIPVEIKVSHFDYAGTPSLLLHVRDVTERREAENALQQSEKRYRLLAQNTKDVIWTADLDLRWTYFSPSIEPLLGYTPEEAMALSIDEILPPASLQLALNTLGEELAFAEQDPDAPPRTRRLELEQVRKDGSTVWVEVVTNFLLGEDGRPAGIIGVARDISERRRIEARLRESEDNFRSFFQTIDDLIVVAEFSGKIVWANPAVTRKLGYSADDLKKMHILDMHRPEDRKSAESILDEMFRGDRTECPLPLVTKDGRLLPVETRAWKGKWSGNDVLFGIAKDLSEQQAALEMFEKVFTANPAPMALNGIEDRSFVAVNRAFCEMTGYDGSEVIGKTSEELQLFAEPEEHSETAAQLDHQGSIHNVALAVRTKNDELRDALFFGQIVESQGERLLLTAAFDVTEQKRIEHELRETQDTLERRVAERTAELRSTNDALIAEIAVRCEAETSLEKHRRRLRELATRLTLSEEEQRRRLAVQLHDTIGQELAMARLRLERLGSGIRPEYTMHMKTVTELIDAACEHVHHLTDELGATVLYELGLPAALRSLGKYVSDAHDVEFEYRQEGEYRRLDKPLEVQLFRAVRELVYNVLRHAHASRLEVILAMRAGEVAAIVADDGCGFLPESGMAETNEEGSGFGLFSIREQLVILGGHLELVSSPGGGTKVTVIIPRMDLAAEQEGE